MKTELIEVIKKTIHVLENDLVKYHWFSANFCNCGVLTQQALNIDANKLAQKMRRNRHSGSWREDVLNCSLTGIPVDEVFKRLFELGLTAEDIGHLEDLSDDKVLAKMGLVYRFSPPVLRREKKDDLIKYLKAWAELLEEENAPNEKPVRREIKAEREIIIVDMDSKARQLPKEIVYN